MSSSLFLDPRHYDARVKLKGDVPFWKRRAEQAGGPILELACGTGRISIPLAQSGFDVTGLDISLPMLRRARKKARMTETSINWIQAGMEQFSVRQSYSLIFIPFNSVCHLLENRSLFRCLTTVRRHLKPEGVFGVDLFNPDPTILARDPEEVHPHSEYEHPDGSGTVEVFEQTDYNRRTQISENTLLFQLPCEEELRKEIIRMRTFFPREFRSYLRRTGFEVVETFGDHAENSLRSDSPFQIYLARPACPPVSKPE